MSDDTKEKPVLSAAQVKKPVGHKERLIAPKGEGWPDVVTRAGLFTCIECTKDKPDREIGRQVNGLFVCAACHAKTTAKLDPAYRTSSGNTLASALRGKHKQTAKRYATGRLPKWMYS